MNRKGHPVREHLHTRLAALRREFETGQTELEKIEWQRTYLRETLLRISGAIQVLEELLAEGEPAGQTGGGSPDTPLTAVSPSSKEQSDALGTQRQQY